MKVSFTDEHFTASFEEVSPNQFTYEFHNLVSTVRSSGEFLGSDMPGIADPFAKLLQSFVGMVKGTS